MNYSLLQYAGGKTRAIKELKKYIPENTKEVMSPFFGGGSFEIYLAKNGVKVFGYDISYPLVCFWKCVLFKNKKLVEEINKYFPLSKELFYNLQKEINQTQDELKVGTMYFILNRSSFSGTTLSGGMSPNHPRFTLSAINRIEKFNEKFFIECLEFEKSISKHDCLIYADPPYLISQFLYGNNGDAHKNFNHNLLSNILNERGNFILSYNNCEEIRDLYYKHKFQFPNWKYGMGNNKESKEILIISKDIKI